MQSVPLTRGRWNKQDRSEPLWVIGRASGTLTDFKYSKAMRKAGITWDENTLAQYLIKPKNFILGTKMAFRGLDTSEEIQDVIAYITKQTK